MRQPEQPFNFLFEAAAEGLELQQQIEAADAIGQSAMTGALRDFQEPAEPAEHDELAATAFRAVSLSATADSLRTQLAEKEQATTERMAGQPLAVRMLPGEGRKLIPTTYFSSGHTGTRRQEFGSLPRGQRKGTFRAALLGQNALVLFPQLLAGQTDLRNILVPILRADGEPNIAIQQRDPSWRDRLGLSARAETRY